MHMSDALVSFAVGAAMDTASLGAMAYSIKKVKAGFDEKKIPLMGVMGAFVFAGQMINFTIPGTGSSGHIGGAVLLSAILGPYPAFITMAAILLIQALFFADGGLLAYGCNLFNMGFFACFVAYPLLFKPILKRGFTRKNIAVASIAASVVGLQLGAFSVVLETKASMITALPFSTFVLFMQPIHLAIGVIEGILTAVVLCFVYEMRPEILESTWKEKNMISGTGMKKVLIIGAGSAFIIAGLLSLAASSKPDGLEWSIEKVSGQEELSNDTPIHDKAGELQEKTAFLPDYSLKEAEGSSQGTIISGLVGSLLTLSVCAAAAYLIMKSRRKNGRKV